MKAIRLIYHFLGSVYFALLLIAAVAIYVVAGTFLESITQSHRYAALFTYESPVFGVLLWGFFINILFAATRRWPFRVRHVPFLTTHLGLLMILAGVLMKHYFGVQGSMHITEGSGSHEIFAQNSYAVSIQGRNDPTPKHYPLEKTISGRYNPLIANRSDGLSLRLAEFHPHTAEWLSTWVKGSSAMLAGLKPLPMEKEGHLIPAGKIRFYQGDFPVWDIYALRTDDIAETIHKLYLKNANLVVTRRDTGEELLNSPLEGKVRGTIKLSFPFSPGSGCNDSICTFAIEGTDVIDMPLQGNMALQNINLATPYLGNFPLTADIVRTPLLAVIENSHHDVYLVAFDQYGKVWTHPFLKDKLESFISYDDGFSGYSVRVDLPFNAYPSGRKERENALAFHLLQQLNQEPIEEKKLSPPLQILWRATEKVKVNFPETLVAFLVYWDNNSGWLYSQDVPLPSSLEKVFGAIDWSGVAKEDLQGCQWAQLLFSMIDPLMKEKMTPSEALKQSGWPLMSLLEKNKMQDDEELLTLLTQQIFAASTSFPPAPNSDDDVLPEKQAALLSAYLRAYSIHLKTIVEYPSEEEMYSLLYASQSNLFANDIAEAYAKPISLETSLVATHESIPPGNKLEDNIPKVLLYVSQGEHKQAISLAYDPSGVGLKWPILDGKYLLRFQPLYKEIPYHIRLRQARQINYANSAQAFSYEADLIITDRSKGIVTEKTISMNHVYETWDGYRFYLSSIATPSDSGAKRIQIVVNRDPAKYYMTYPGAIILSCGIVMLFVYLARRRES